MCYATFSYGRTQQYGLVLGFFLITLALSITGYYHYLQDPRFHQNAYAILTAIVLFRSMYVMEINIRPSYKAKERELQEAREGKKILPAERERQDKRDLKILSTMWTMIAYGLTIFLGGFAIWNLDNIYCSDLRKWRREIGLPWGVVLEGHGWWHIMTGIGAYFYITWGIWLRHCLNGKQDEYELRWPRLLTSLPSIVRRNNIKGFANGYGNGSAKKTT
ncbi:MAG: hypothetical protein M1822_006890 [Bathelium mastoideum]|nr:MAG: hypothetical protein M1822_006890 [Bathelium mastoideum]